MRCNRRKKMGSHDIKPSSNPTDSLQVIKLVWDDYSATLLLILHRLKHGFFSAFVRADWIFFIIDDYNYPSKVLLLQIYALFSVISLLRSFSKKWNFTKLSCGFVVTALKECLMRWEVLSRHPKKFFTIDFLRPEPFVFKF